LMGNDNLQPFFSRNCGTGFFVASEIVE